MTNPLGSSRYERINNFANTDFGLQENLGGGQGRGHGGVDMISYNDSDADPESRRVYAPVTGWIANYQDSSGTITVWNVKDDFGQNYPGLVVKLTHVESPSGPMIKGQPLTYYSRKGIYDDTRTHLHLGVIWHINGDYRDTRPENIIYFNPENFIS